jgi:multicomponent Na+:H+ antiporter subunit D
MRLHVGFLGVPASSFTRQRQIKGMTYAGLALLVGVPLAFAGTATALRRLPAHIVATLAMVAVAAGAIVTTPEESLAIAGADLVLTQIARLQLVFLSAVGAMLVAFHYLAGRAAPLPAILPVLLAAIGAGLVFGGELLVAASFLQLAALVVSLLMIGEQPDWQASLAGAVYLVLSALGGVALLFGFVLADLQRLSPGGLVTVPFVVAAISIGLSLLWGVAPLHAWLPNAFQRAGPASVVLAVSLMGPATLGLLLHALSTMPQLVADNRVNQYLTLGGLGTAIFGALAAIAPGKLRRVLGYVLVSDLGYVIVGMATFTRIGVAGAVLHMAHRSLVALVLIGAASELERDDRGSLEDSQAAPYMWATILLGTLSLVGMPPFAGFAANWAIYQAASLTDVRVALILALTSGICLIAVVATLGRLRRGYRWPWRPPRPAEVLIMALAGLSAVWGLVPGPVLGAIHAAVSQLPFLKPL